MERMRNREGRDDGRISFKPLHPSDIDRLNDLAKAKDETLSYVTAYAVNQWLVENYEKHLKYYQ